MVYGYLFIALGLQKVAYTLPSVGIALSITLIFNHLRMYLWAKLWTILVINSALLLYGSYFGKESGVYYLSFVFLSVPFLLFKVDEFWKIAASSALPILTFLSTEWQFFESIAGNIAPQNALIIRQAVILLVFIWLLMNFFHFLQLHSKSEQQLLHTIEELDGQVLEKQRMYDKLMHHERKLLDQNIELQASAKKLKRFSFRLSHEIRSPLANVLGLTNILSNDRDDQEMKMLASESRRMDEIIKNANSDLERLDVKR